MLTLAFATGTEPGKWLRRYRERVGPLTALDADEPMKLLIDGSADLALTRLPDPRVHDAHHVVHLYEEQTGIAVSKDSVYDEVGERVRPEDLDGEMVNYRIASDGAINYDELRAALQVVGANVGVAIAPRPLLKILSKKQVIPLEFVDPTVPVTSIALVWLKARDTDAIQDFVGIAKGRTPNSSRQSQPKRSAREKALAKQARRAGKNTSAHKFGGKRMRKF